MESAMLVRKYMSMLSSPFRPYLPRAGKTLSSLILLLSSFAAFPFILFIFCSQPREKKKKFNITKPSVEIVCILCLGSI